MSLALLLTGIVALAMPVAVDATSVALPPDSVYQTSIRLTDARSRGFDWGEQRGQAQIVSMFYTSCTFTCPLLVESARAVVESLNAAERANLGIMLISLDPERDTAQALARMQRERSIEAPNWTLVKPAPRDVRRIAGLLGVRYRPLADGGFNHTTALVLLDAEGRIVARTANLGGWPDAAFLSAVRKTLSTH